MLKLLRSESLRPTATATELTVIPTIDGTVLTDKARVAVKPASGFTQVRPNEGQPALQKIEVYIGYTDEVLYIGVMAYDDESGSILVTDSRRDSPLEDTDSFRIIIDGLLDCQNGYVFGTNPAGIEYDVQVIHEGGQGGFVGRSSGAGGFNLNWDTTWKVEAQINELGWSTEFEIPFNAMRYGSGDSQTRGVNFQRNIRRYNEESYRAPLDRNFDLNRVSEAGYVEDVRVPSQRLLQFTPYALSVSEQGGALTSSQSREEYGLKRGITPCLTLDTTVNTDFAQVEVDDIQVNWIVSASSFRGSGLSSWKTPVSLPLATRASWGCFSPVSLASTTGCSFQSQAVLL